MLFLAVWKGKGKHPKFPCNTWERRVKKYRYDKKKYVKIIKY